MKIGWGCIVVQIMPWCTKSNRSLKDFVFFKKNLILNFSDLNLRWNMIRKISPTALNSVSAMAVHTTWTKSLQESHTALVLVQRTVVMETLHLNSPCRQYKSPERCIGVKKQQAFSVPVSFLSLSLSFSTSPCLASLCHLLLEMDKSKYLEVISSVFVWDLCKWIQADYFGSAGLNLRLCGESWRIVRWYTMK